jgi:hypothetical protein
LKLDESSGDAIDSSGRGHDGSLQNGVIWAPSGGTIDGGATFDGSNDFIVVTDSDDFDFAGKKASFSVWFKAPAQNETYYPVFLDHYTGSGAGWFFGWYNGGDRIQFTHAAASGSSINLRSPGTYDDDSWHHAVVTMADSTAKLYIDGSEVDTDAYDTLQDRDQNLTIGGAGPSNSFTGTMDDIRIYNYELSSTQVAALYNGGSGGSTGCTDPNGTEGEIIYNNSENVMQFCNSNGWQAMGPAGDGGGGCSNPTGEAGEMIYNTSYDVMQYCEGDEWIAVGKTN